MTKKVIEYFISYFIRLGSIRVRAISFANKKVECQFIMMKFLIQTMRPIKSYVWASVISTLLKVPGRAVPSLI